MTPEERTTRARLAAHAKWAAEENPSEATKPAREAFLARFERQVDPNNELDSKERQRRAEHAKKAYMLRLSLASAKARRLRKQ